MSQSKDDVTEMNEGTLHLTEDERHRLLEAERRRVALDVLADRTVPVDLRDLAAAVAARETDGIGADEETVERVVITLHHRHLPKMDTFGVISYDPETNQVKSCPRGL